MKSSRITAVASVVVLSLLLFGIVPVAAQTNQNSPMNPATTLVQLAQAAQTYAQNLLNIGQQQGVNVTVAQTLINQGSTLLTQAQNEVNTNSTQAAKDALMSMSDFHSAAVNLQTEVVVSVSLTVQETYLQKGIQTGENRTSQLQTIVNKACSSSNASASVCADANTNLSQASSELNNASSLLASITASSAQGAISAIEGLLKDASGHLQAAYSDLATLSNSEREQKATTFVQTVLDPKVTQLQNAAQNANLTSSQLQQVQSLLSGAQTSLNSADQSFQSGNFTSGIEQVNQAEQSMVSVAHDIWNDDSANYVQNKLIPQIAVIQNDAQNAHLNASLSQTVQSQLSQAQTLLDNAIQSFQSGNSSAGAQQVQQAMQLMQQAIHEIQGH
jgi:hypothetical protein